MCEPAPASVAIARCSAACPLEVAMAPTPPSSAATRSSSTAFVGFEMRLYTCPERSMLNSDAACSLFSNTKEVVRWMGTARAPVAGSGAAPACRARVSNAGSEEPAIGDPRVCRSRGLWAILGRPPARGGTMKVSDILRVKGGTLFTVSPDTALSQAVTTMAENDIGSLVVMGHGELVGMLTFREVIQSV